MKSLKHILLFSLALVLNCFALADKKPVKVFILAGQSNMEGKGRVDPLLNHQITAPETKDFFAHLHKDGKYIKRDDVWINYLERRGKLTVGYGSPGRIGLELEFGHVMGNHFEEPVLLIKAAWGGKSIGARLSAAKLRSAVQGEDRRVRRKHGEARLQQPHSQRVEPSEEGQPENHPQRDRGERATPQSTPSAKPRAANIARRSSTVTATFIG